MKKAFNKLIVGSIILSFLVFACENLKKYSSSSKDKMKVTYSETVDGDTAKFIVGDKIITCRFLGIDTPESVHPDKQIEPYALEASKYTQSILENCNEILLEYDKNSSRKDKYSRELCWVWVDGELIQEKVLREGYGKLAYLYGDYKYINFLRAAENYTKNNKLGIWN